MVGVQIATNSQYSLGYNLFPNPTDTRILRPFLTTLKEHFLIFHPIFSQMPAAEEKKKFKKILIFPQTDRTKN